MNVMVAFGTRPEAIKLAPVITELRRRGSALVTVVTTGQHREMVEQALRPFAIHPDVDLDVMATKQSLGELSSRLLPAITDLLTRTRPDVLVVQGDTTSAFLSALASFYARVPVAHVEAGLRTNDPAEPFPEEINRRLTAVLTAVHFAPTARARHNLLAEGIPSEAIHVTGNTVVDALEFIRRSDAFASTRPAIEPGGGERLLLVTLHRRESWGVTLESMCRALRTIVQRHTGVRVAFPVHPNPVVHDVVSTILGGVERVALLEPLEYLSFLALLDASWLVLTDSGGVQEEAPVLGKPVLVLREATERPEAIDAGLAKLVGTREDSIVDTVSRLIAQPAERDAMARAASPFGDGHAAGRIADVLAATFDRASMQAVGRP